MTASDAKEFRIAGQSKLQVPFTGCQPRLYETNPWKLSIQAAKHDYRTRFRLPHPHTQASPADLEPRWLWGCCPPRVPASAWSWCKGVSLDSYRRPEQHLQVEAGPSAHWTVFTFQSIWRGRGPEESARGLLVVPPDQLRPHCWRTVRRERPAPLGVYVSSDLNSNASHPLLQICLQC